MTSNKDIAIIGDSMNLIFQKFIYIHTFQGIFRLLNLSKSDG
jgi:hypothetical protein